MCHGCLGEERVGYVEGEGGEEVPHQHQQEQGQVLALVEPLPQHQHQQLLTENPGLTSLLYKLSKYPT
jgi:hypothetical protein